MKIESAKLVKYNANTRGTSTGDCTARSISLAFNIDYSKVRKMMNASAKKLRYRSYNYDGNVNTVIADLGGGYRKRPDKKISVNEFADTNPQGTYLVGCSKLTEDRATHLVCIIDGVVYDSWDSRVYFVDEYWVIENGTKGSDITDVGYYLREWVNSKTASEYVEYIVNVFNDIIDKNRRLKKVVDKYNVDIKFTLEVTKISLVNYTFNYGGEICVRIPAYNIKKTYSHKFSIVFNPTMSPDNVQPYFEEHFYGKLYPQVQQVIHKVEDICEGYSLTKDVDVSDRDLWIHSYEKKNFFSLPYWAQRLATYFTAGAPFQEKYSDSVRLDIKTPPFDTHYGETTEYAYKANERTFEAYSMAELKEGLDYYKKTGDYDKAWRLAAYGDYAE